MTSPRENHRDQRDLKSKDMGIPPFGRRASVKQPTEKWGAAMKTEGKPQGNNVAKQVTEVTHFKKEKVFNY